MRLETTVAVADVSGHGIEAALVMAQLRGLLWALSTDSADPGQVLAEINPLLAHKLTQFITMFLGYLDALTHSLVYAAAGHNGLIIRANGDVEELCSTTTPLEVLDNLDTDTISICLDPGDVLIVLTDGLEEATGISSKPFGIVSTASKHSVEHSRWCSLVPSVVGQSTLGSLARGDAVLEKR